MNKIIKDLGMIKSPTANKPKHYVLVKCYDCNTELTLRKDRLSKICRCKSCQLKQRTIKAKQKAKSISNLENTKTCTICKLTKHVYDFHKKEDTLAGTRSVCKACRYFTEQLPNKLYIKSESGKLTSIISQGKRRESIYKTNDKSITKQALLDLKEKQNHKCYYCKCKLDYSSPNQVHLDHLIPLSKNGTHTITNVVWSCASCNSSKNNKIIVQ